MFLLILFSHFPSTHVYINLCVSPSVSQSCHFTPRPALQCLLLILVEYLLTVFSRSGQEWQPVSSYSHLLARLGFRSLVNTVSDSIPVPQMPNLFRYSEIISWKCSIIYIIYPLRNPLVLEAVKQFSSPISGFLFATSMLVLLSRMPLPCYRAHLNWYFLSGFSDFQAHVNFPLSEFQHYLARNFLTELGSSLVLWWLVNLSHCTSLHH